MLAYLIIWGEQDQLSSGVEEMGLKAHSVRSEGPIQIRVELGTLQNPP